MPGKYAYACENITASPGEFLGVSIVESTQLGIPSLTVVQSNECCVTVPDDVIPIGSRWHVMRFKSH
jgi:hypothetical protein